MKEIIENHYISFQSCVFGAKKNREDCNERVVTSTLSCLRNKETIFSHALLLSGEGVVVVVCGCVCVCVCGGGGVA